MNREKEDLVIRIHQFLILVLLVFSLFVKPEIKMIFWGIMGIMLLSLLIIHQNRQEEEKKFKDHVGGHRHEI